MGEQFFVTENDVFQGDMGAHSRADGSRVRISQVVDDETVSVGFTHTTRSPSPKEILMLVVTCQSLVKTAYTPTAGDPELTEEHGDHDGHEGELDARVLPTIVLQR